MTTTSLTAAPVYLELLSMEEVGKIVVFSSWLPSETLHSVLSVTLNSDIHHDSTSGSSVPITLSQPPSHEMNEACYIFVNVSKLPRHFVREVELVSGSRTVEVYTSNGEEYLTTCKGMHLERLRNGTSLYSCNVGIPSISEISLKLLSLKGRSSVLLTKLHISLYVDNEESIIQTPATTISEDIEQLASCASLQSAPPILRLLVSSLQNYAANRTDLAPSQMRNSTVPPDLSQMMTAFKQLRPIQDHPTESEEKATAKEATKQSSVQVNEDVIALVEYKVSEMEKRMLEYIDSKIVNLQCQMDTMYKTFLSKLDMNTHHCTDVINDEQLD